MLDNSINNLLHQLNDVTAKCNDYDVISDGVIGLPLPSVNLKINFL